MNTLDTYIQNQKKPIFKINVEEIMHEELYSKYPKTYSEIYSFQRKLKNNEKSIVNELFVILSNYNIVLSGDIFFNTKYNRYYYESDFVFEIGDQLQNLFTNKISVEEKIQHLICIHKIETQLSTVFNDKYLEASIACHGNNKAQLGIPFLNNFNYIDGRSISLELVALEKFFIVWKKKYKLVNFSKEELYRYWLEAYLLTNLPANLFEDTFKKSFSASIPSVKERKEILTQFADAEGFLIIYRGVTHKEGEKLGFSWTIHKGVAESFASRFSNKINEGYVVTGKIHIDDIYDSTIGNEVLAYEEFEVFPNIKNVQILSEE